MSKATVLNLESQARTTSSDSGTKSVRDYTVLAVDIDITAVSGTSTPALTLTLYRIGVNGIDFALWTSAHTAAGKASTSVGPGCSIAQALGTDIKLGWTITGTTPSFTFSASLIGE